MAEIETVRVTYREISERFGIGLEGARIKAKRRATKGLWKIIPGNHPQDVIRVEIPADEFNEANPVGRGAGNSPNDLPPTGPVQHNTQQEGERREGNDLESLVDLLGQLAMQASSMTDRLIETERGKAVAEKEAALLRMKVEMLEKDVAATRTNLDAAERGFAKAQDQHVAELQQMQARLEAEANRARNELTTFKSLPWWKRLAG